MLKNLFFILILINPCILPAQENSFESEILAFEEEDRRCGYKKDFVLFTGSSSIRLWHSLEKDMKGLDVLNRGFGGSTLKALNKNWNRIATDHKPAIVVLYCGENDIAEGSTVAQTVAQFKVFAKKYKERYQSIPLIYIAMKPSISRWGMWSQFQTADKEIKEIIDQNENMTFIDLSESMFKDGDLKEKIFLEDGLHMNSKGYKGWRKQLKPIIEQKILSK